MNNKPEKLCFSVTEAAKRLGLSRNLTYEAVKRGDIPSIKIGKRLLVPIAALEHFLNKTTDSQRKAN